MASLVLVDVLESYVASVEGRLKARREVSGVRRRGPEGDGLAILVDLDDPRSITEFLTNQVELITGVTACRTVHRPDETMLGMFARA